MPNALIRRPRTAAFAAALGLAAAVQPACAITINLTPVLAGETFDIGGNTATDAPALTGTGTLDSVMTAAAAYWEAIFLDPGTLNVEYGWDRFTGTTLASARQYLEPRDFSGAGRQGDIRFDSDGTSRYFADDDPGTSETYGTLLTETADLGGGTMVTGRVYQDRMGAAAGRFDLFTTAIHELGHLLGFVKLAEPVDAAFAENALTLTSGPFAEAELALSGGHLSSSVFPNGLMDATTGGKRILASDADIAAIAEFSGFEDVNYAAAVFDMAPVPLPAGVFLMLGALGALAGVARRDKARAGA